MSALTPKLKDLVDRARNWPADVQDVLAEMGASLEAGRSGVYAPSADELAAIDEGLAQLERGEFATSDRVTRALSSFSR